MKANQLSLLHNKMCFPVLLYGNHNGQERYLWGTRTTHLGVPMCIQEFVLTRAWARRNSKHPKNDYPEITSCNLYVSNHASTAGNQDNSPMILAFVQYFWLAWYSWAQERQAC